MVAKIAGVLFQSGREAKSVLWFEMESFRWLEVVDCALAQLNILLASRSVKLEIGICGKRKGHCGRNRVALQKK